MIRRTEPTTSKSSAREDEAVRLHPPDIFATDGHDWDYKPISPRNGVGLFRLSVISLKNIRMRFARVAAT
jgi:hypothetical protein